MNNQQVFLALLRAGLWEEVKENLNPNLFEILDWGVVQQLAEEQSVIGLVTAGIEKFTAYNFFAESDLTSRCSAPFQGVPLAEKLTLLGKCQLIEQHNAAMNQFVGELVDNMRNAGIYAVLVKGQGIAQCYERPLWRASGDVDFLLSDDDYDKAKRFLLLLATDSGKDYEGSKHLGLTIDNFKVELHGNQCCGLSKRMDAVINEVQRDVFFGGNVRLWQNDDTQVFLPGVDCDVIFVFTHFLKHFYKGGLGLRQICDWCRLLWTYKDEIDVYKLEVRLHQMRLVTEWKAFAAFAVDWLGMPIDAMPLYDASNRWKRKARRIEDFVMMSGNFGHNRDSSYWVKYPYLIRKAFSMKRRMGDLIRHARIFPLDSIRFFPNIMRNGFRLAVKGV